MAVEDDILAEIEADVKEPPAFSKTQDKTLSFYDKESERRNESISLPDTTGQTSADFQAKIARRPGFNEPFKTDQRGNRIAINEPSPEPTEQAGFNQPFRTDQKGNRIAITDEWREDQAALREARREQRAIDQAERNAINRYGRSRRTVKRTSDLREIKDRFDSMGSPIQSKIAEIRRRLLGQPEIERQLKVAFNYVPLTIGQQLPQLQPNNLDFDAVDGDFVEDLTDDILF